MAKMSVHRRLPKDSPVYPLIGQVASDWALLEHILDLVIWHLVRLDDPTGACVTAQIMGAAPRLFTIEALCKQRKLSKEVLDQVTALRESLYDVQERRNRILHDPWYYGEPSQKSEQYKSMARKEHLSGFYEVDTQFLEETLAKIDRRLQAVGELRDAIIAAT
jgi:hypothetical protein